MKSKTFKIDSKSLTKNNIEKIKKSIDCLKETLKRSNSHLYLIKAKLHIIIKLMKKITQIFFLIRIDIQIIHIK